jgi:hypothetical protein
MTNANTAAWFRGPIFGLHPSLAAAVALFAGSLAMAAVPAGDITLKAPIQGDMPIISPLCGYENSENAAAAANADKPVFSPYLAWTDAWWDNLVAELLQARITNVSFATRGSYSINPGDLNGPGNMNPRRLKQFVDATNRAGVTSMFKIACFLDAPSAQEIYNNFYGLPANTKQNMADNSAGVANHWHEIWWLRFVKPWFDTVPQSMWFLENGRPRLEFWGFGSTENTTNQQGNCSGVVNYVAARMQETYGVTPNFIGACAQDSTFSSNPLVLVNNPWFAPPNHAFRYRVNANGYSAGTVVPGYGDPTNANYMRRNKPDGSGVNGDTLRDALNSALDANCRFNLLEGWTNVVERMGFYRTTDSPTGAWDYPNQYINILRPYTDLRTVTLRLEAEGCDQYSDTTTGNSGGSFLRAGEDLDVRGLVGTPVVSATSTLAGYPAENGMDAKTNTKWIANGALPQSLQYDYGSGRAAVVNTYYVTSADNDPNRDPKDWTLEGSNNGTVWTAINSQAGITFPTRKMMQTFAVTNATAYRFYRLRVTALANSTSNNLQVGDFRITGSTPTGSGWAVTDTAANEWLDFYGVQFSSGYYKFPIRYSSTAARTVRLSVDGVALPDVVLPSTGNMATFDTAYLGARHLGHGPHNLRVTFVDGGVDVDWIFAKKADPMVSFQSDLTGRFLTAEQGGNQSFTCNRTTAGIWERFSVNSLTGGSGALANGAVAHLQPYIGYYATAEANGGGALTANRRTPGVSEEFTLVKISGSAGSSIINGDKVALRSSSGAHYVTVVNSSTVNVSGTAISSGQTFTVNLTGQ